MKRKSTSLSAFFTPRVLIGVSLCAIGMSVAFLAFSNAFAQPGTGRPAGQETFITQAQYRGVLPVEKFDVSPPLRDITPIPPGQGGLREHEEEGPIPLPKGVDRDPVVQSILPKAVAIPTPTVSFNGPPNLCGGCAPPDPNGDVGPNHVVVMSNLDFQVFNKAGTSLFGPAANNTLWSNFGGHPCQTQNAGDPVVLYDQLADRWILSQFTATAVNSTYYECVAISTTGDPTGTYYRYAIPTGTNNFPDYPKAGIFPDAYYFSTREFAGGATFVGVGAYALNRAQALAGNPNAQIISFLAPPSPAFNVGDGLLPADLDGMTLPPAGSPEYFVGSMDNNGPYGAPQDALTVWKFVANFANPPASSFTLTSTITDPAAFNSILALCGGARTCIPQPSTTNRIDHLGYRQRPLHRAAYRNFGAYESIITNQSVSAGTGPSGEVSGIRWWELRSPGSSPAIFQEGTYAPGLTDGVHRWMGSIAADNQANMALAYSASDGTLVFPSVRYTGRLAGDPLGQMPQGEAAIIAGTGSQTGGGSRWGDYTSTTVDPTDDCTFWHVNEWVPTTSTSGWQLRIGAFKFDQCTAPPRGTAHFTVTACGGAVLANAVVSIDGAVYGATAANGTFDATLAPGTHTYSITKPTFSTVTGMFNITNGTTTNVNDCIAGSPVLGAAGGTLQAEGCSPNNGGIDPGEAVTVSLCVQNTGGANTTNLVGTLQTGGGVTNPGPPQNYGVVVAGGPAVCRNFTFTADTALQCGATLTASVQFQDGATNLGTFTYNFTTGALVGALNENFDGVTPPGLPTGWTVTQGTNAGGFPLWVTSNSGTPTPVADSLPNSAFSPDPTNLFDNRLNTPPLMFSVGSQLMFRQNYDLEMQNATTAYDAGVLEITNDGGTTWQDITTAGGTFVTGGYNHTFVSTGFMNPIAGARSSWSGVSGGFQTCSVNLPTALAGQTVQFRWRMCSDNSVSHAGWRIDNVTIAQRVCCVSGAPQPSSAVSRKTHTGVGPFDVALPLTGTPGIEPRSGGTTNDYTMVVTFGSPVTVNGTPQSQVISGTGTIGTGGVSNGGVVTISGNDVIVPLTNVTNAQRIQVRLNNVTGTTGSGNVTIPMSVLVGDTAGIGNGAVNSADVSATKAVLDQALSTTNFRSDVNANGAINAGDVSLVKSLLGTGLP